MSAIEPRSPRESGDRRVPCLLVTIVLVEWRDDPWSEVFDDDYLYFYADRLASEHSDRETDLIVQLLDLPPGAAVLDAPCGHGRIANRLAARGLRVTGLDSNTEFLARARRDAEESGVEVEYVLGDLRELPWSGRFDAAVNWYTSFGYFNDQDNRRVLSEYHRALRAGGRLMVDKINRDALIRQMPVGGAPLVALTERGDDLMIDRVHFDLAAGRSRTERIIVRDGRVRRTRFSLSQPSFTELSAWLGEAGFEQSAAYGPGGEKLAPDSRRMLVVAAR
ncbi:MAG: class I SAM-dependent methyltransferase [Thermoleophilaceae bacterium]|nr:class I SAM-dependent methyltransferase [Thermoleophilaceae bacterium]